MSDQYSEAMSEAYMAPPPTPKKDRPVKVVSPVKAREPSTPPRSVRQPDSESIRTPSRLQQQTTPVRTSASAIRRKPVPGTSDKVARPSKDDWEAQLVRDANRLQISPQKQQDETPKKPTTKATQSQDADWERNGMWEQQLGAAREAEDRVRREANREIAYPPTRPTVPIRAGSSGVTSIHVGVRPRLHPSRASESMVHNQPDAALPEPLFSPTAPAQRASLPDETFLKAQAEYEAWLSRKAEREGDAEEGAFGTRDWVPRERVVARPRGVMVEATEPAAIQQQPVPVTAAPQSAASSMDTPLTPSAENPNPFMYPYFDPAYLQQYYGTYWDPYMYGAYGGMMDPSYGMEDGQQTRVSFAPSPDKTRGKAGEEGMTGTGDMYDPSHDHPVMFGFAPEVYQAMLPESYGQPRTSQYGGVGFGLGSSPVPISQGSSMPMGTSMGWMGNTPPMAGSLAASGFAGMPGSMAYGGPMRGSAYPGQVGHSGEGSVRGMGMNGASPYAMPDVGAMGLASPMASMNMGNMMYPQYGWNMPGVGMQQGMWPGAPGAPGGGGAMSPGMTPQAPAGPTPTAASGDTRQAYDPSKSKSSWLGHYGYLEGRELAGPPPGYLPAGMQPWQAQSNSPSPSATKPKKMAASTVAPSVAGYPASSAVGPQSSWGSGGSPGPRARYDGTSAVKWVQADVETPYPRSKSGGMTSAWQHDQVRALSPVDGRLGKSHQRQREGKV